MLRPSLVLVEKDQDHLRISWNNRYIPKDDKTLIFLTLFWIIWAPLTCYVTALIFFGGPVIFCIIWCVFGWLGTLLIPYTLLGRSWSEWIEVNHDCIIWGATGFLARKPKRLPLSKIAEIGVGYFGTESDGAEAKYTLNVFCIPKRSGYRGRHILAYWVQKEDLEMIYKQLHDFLSVNHPSINFHIYKK